MVTMPLLAGGVFACQTIFTSPSCDNKTSGEGRDSDLSFSSSFGQIFEEMMRIRLEAIEDGLLFVDRNGTVIFINRVAETLTGWSGEKAIGCPVDQVFLIMDSRSRHLAINPVRRTLADGRPKELGPDNLLVRGDGSDMAIENVTLPLLDRLGAVMGAVVIFRDACSGWVHQEMTQLG